ncbi:TfoX/Sxy family protein [Gehongia tenuis]|uniref:TfoX/Sxy family protein n=1 Tax=Gehongia tenuis TaxID=2763655 RepID=A0A926D3W6_9FIRM|nr:TfoX/Sxy family protein [Gehongia tenuis]MBC8530429.1 TfoX/Sxy family protein [Gehongia tenuis]
MGKLTELPNVGRVLEERLEAVGIATAEELKKAGAKEAFLRLRERDPGACLHELMALEGAVRGVRKYDLPPEIQDDVKAFFKGLK